MAFEIRDLIRSRLGENYDLHDRHVNRTLVKVLRTIGFDKVYARAEGAYLYDREGRDYLDALGGYGAMNIGRNHPVVKKALADLLSLDMPNMVQMDCSLLSGLLAEALVKRSPPHLTAVFFCNSGAEAVEGAVKFARCATGREKLLFCSRAFHGLTTGALALNGSPMFREGFGTLLAGASVALDDFDALERELSQGEYAGFFFEPVQGKGVYYPRSDTFWPRAQELCRKYGTLLIADEVQTGLGRTGRFYSFQHWGLEPDIVMLAKSLSGGLVPCGAILTRREIYDKTFSRLDRCVVHSSTFGRNNLAMAAGLATLQVIEDEKVVENSARMGKALVDGLAALAIQHEFIREVRGKGLIVAVEFAEPKSLRLRAAWKLIQAADKGLFAQMVVIPLLKNHRILTQVAGHRMDVIKMTPPLIIGQKDVDRIVSAFNDTLADCCKFPGAMWDMGTNLVRASLMTRKAA
ncbi:MAG: aspartate aminotransferase family protein [Verrucomicrobia bacterium]|nr:aspartate aminotransferase family protein [Verrucomicrobiota bacterium]